MKLSLVATYPSDAYLQACCQGNGELYYVASYKWYILHLRICCPYAAIIRGTLCNTDKNGSKCNALVVTCP